MVKPQDDTQLVSLSLQQFVKSVGARTAAPGGGSVSAAVAALVGKTSLRFCDLEQKVRKTKPTSFHTCYTLCAAGGSTGRHGGSNDLREETV